MTFAYKLALGPGVADKVSNVLAEHFPEHAFVASKRKSDGSSPAIEFLHADRDTAVTPNLSDLDDVTAVFFEVLRDLGVWNPAFRAPPHDERP